MYDLHVVVGAQFGSEGKGHVTAQLVAAAAKTGPTVNVRVAGPNAGHTVIDSELRAFALRTVPVGAAVSNDVTCYIAPGSEVEIDVLLDEVEELRAAGHPVDRLYVSGEATILATVHKQQEKLANLTEKVGSTGKGIGACRADRLMRGAQRVRDSIHATRKLDEAGVHVVLDDANFLATKVDAAHTVVVEGTQGYGLGLHAGHYPQCTSSDTRAIDFLAMAGLNPWDWNVRQLNVWACARVYPIRVAGNSGPLQDETTWEELGLPEEKTTVTHKTRRVGNWDPKLVADAVRANGNHPTVRLALTMVDQKIPAIAGAEGSLSEHLSNQELCDLVEQVQKDTNCKVAMVTTSPHTCLR